MVDEHPMEWPASACKTVDEQDDEIERLTAEVTKWKAEQEKAFRAGWTSCWLYWEAGVIDEEQAWQQYRCQDETDWKSVSGREGS